ncbi:MAG: hypothetical protein FD128_2384, partial [Hyphomonadaceae bacterium]
MSSRFICASFIAVSLSLGTAPVAYAQAQSGTSSVAHLDASLLAFAAKWNLDERDFQVLYDEDLLAKAGGAIKYQEFVAAADANDPVAALLAGICAAYGKGRPKSNQDAVAFYRRANRVPFPYAMVNLGGHLGYGIGTRRDLREAMNLYRRAAEAGNGFAMAEMGSHYITGIGVTKNVATGISWLEKAVVAGSPSGMVMLGGLYNSGAHVAKDHSKAMQYYRMGEAIGDDTSILRIG